MDGSASHRLRLLAVTWVGVSSLWACGSAPRTSVAGSGDSAFSRLAGDILEDRFLRHPTSATDLGIHKYNSELEDYSRNGVAAEVQALRSFRDRLDKIDAATLTSDKRLDREQLVHALDSALLTLEVIKPWAKDADTYSAGITNTAYVMIKRNFAPPDERLKQLIAREKKMPEALAEARANLQNPPRVYTEIAIEQIDGNHRFFEADVPAAFKDVTDQALLAEFQQANIGVLVALDHYKNYLQQWLLPNSKGSFALGSETFLKKWAADEMVDLPLDQLLRIAEADRQKNEDVFVATAKSMDPAKLPAALLASLQKDHPSASQLLRTTQDMLDSLRQFVVSHHIVTIPESDPARVKETPPFMRSTTTASMDTPGPFEHVAKEAYYTMTLPDPRWSAARQAEYMGQWYDAAISNVSVHEVYPGHYLQFLYAGRYPSDVRRVYSASSNSEGWAHYCEKMMLDEGFHADEPKYRLAQLQDALLRDVRFIVGIKMHTQGMTVGEAARLFETAGHQPAPVALQEAKRGTSDATYGYYTLGKLMILKLRDDYKRKLGPAYTLQGFHDAFIRLGPLPLPLIRKAMLGETGEIL